MSRLAQSSPDGVSIVALDRPFSNFLFADIHFNGRHAIRRLFSQARCRDCKTLIMEEIPAEGAVADENIEILKFFPDHQMTGLKRLSFWLPQILEGDDLSARSDADCIGYAILKRDKCPSKSVDNWHVFESAIRKYEHPHNYNPCAKKIDFRVQGKIFTVGGTLYCQQNTLNKACAQVSLRSICAGYLNNFDLTFSRINNLAYRAPEAPTPWAGLRSDQIMNVLTGLGIPAFELKYDPKKKGRRKVTDSIPFQRVLYSGIEAGCGGLLGFKLSGPEAKDRAHVLPYFGHTFNEDTWAPNADIDYFKVGEDLRYTPSDAWLSSFIIHDDNLGSNLCIPRWYLKRELTRYIVALLPQGYVYNGLFAEAAGADYFYSIVDKIPNPANAWVSHLIRYAGDKRLILRHVPITKNGYVDHLNAMQDWEGGRENSEVLRQLREETFTDKMWMVELSIPDLFSTNKRKIGELLLDAGKDYRKTDFTHFVLARFPGTYMFFDKFNEHKLPEFLTMDSLLKSHTPLLGTEHNI